MLSASESGGTMKKKNIQYSSMKQPPLIKQLKGILSEYPDGGQILKVYFVYTVNPLLRPLEKNTLAIKTTCFNITKTAIFNI